MPTATLAPTTDILGVELVRVGKWDASKGDGNVTAEDIAAMAAAAAHPLADRAIIKIGHDDSRFQDANGNPPADGDGNPAYGHITNIRASADGQTLLGDLVQIPAKLAEIMPSAYPDRSVEFIPGKRIGGKVFRAALTAVALLGETAPAVKGLNDLYALYAAALEVEPVRLHVVDDTPTIHHSQRNPADGAGDIQSPILGGTVAVSQAVRKALELADDATDEQVNAALTAAGLSVLPVAPAEPATPAAVEPPAAPAAPPALPVAASAAPAPGDVVTVSAVAFSEAQTRLSAAETELAQIRAEKDKERRDAVIAFASSTGRISPTEVTYYRAQLDVTEDTTTAFLKSRPVTIPMVEVGHGQSTQLSDDEVATKRAAIRNRFFPKES